MNSIELACLSRVRMLALAAMARAGGTPAPWQLRRAVEPIIADLLDELRVPGQGPTKASAAALVRLPTVDSIIDAPPSPRDRGATGGRPRRRR